MTYDINNKVIQGDCLEVMKDIPDKSIDMVLTSPPYDNLRTYNGSLDWGEHIWKPIIKELFRIIKNGGVVVWVVGDATIKGSETGTSFKQALYFKETGFNLHDTMIWEKDGCIYPETNRYYPIFEYMFILSKGKPKTCNQIVDRKNKNFGQKIDRERKSRLADGSFIPTSSFGSNKKTKEFGVRYNIWKFGMGGMKGTKDKIAHKHPATFPEKLAHDHIISWSNEGDTILDPFAGSGTTGKMAKQLNRNYILIEKEPEYIKIIKERLNY
jgi:DNA modification methylase